MRQPFTLGIHVPDYNCEPSAGFFFFLFTKICRYMFALRFKKNILHLIAGCVHHKIFNMHVKPVCKFLCLKVEEKSKTIELIAILAPPKKPA